MVYKKNRLLALLPACESVDGKTLISHGGLTFGGLIAVPKVGQYTMLTIVQALQSYLYERNFSELLYKEIPYIYSSLPTEADAYALFRSEAEIVKIELSTCIYLSCTGTARYRNINKARQLGLNSEFSTNISAFWNILATRLKKHNVSPTHSLAELELLYNRFPDNIKPAIVNENTTLIAGAVAVLL